MATSGAGPGPGNRQPFRKTFAQMVGGNLPSSWNKNILEVVLEKDERGPFHVSDSECSHLLKKLGIVATPGADVESIQICPTGRGVILITFRQAINIDQFSRYDVLEVTQSGIRAVNVKPAGRRDVVVSIKGLHPNTRDDGVIAYLNKYGKVVTTKVVYGTFGEGPLKGLKNGDRAYKVEVNGETNIGTYHSIDGQRVTIRYPGQLSTCARCHETAVACPGGAIARRCEAAQGPKVEFSDYIIKLWDKIGYVPGEIEIAAVYDEHVEYDAGSGAGVQQVGDKFTPPKKVAEPEKYSGVNIKQFPKETDNGDIMEYLVSSGLPEGLKDNVVIRHNGSVSIKNLENSVALNLITNIHNKIQFGKKLFCNGFIALTPEKEGLSSSPVLPDMGKVTAPGPTPGASPVQHDVATPAPTAPPGSGASPVEHDVVTPAPTAPPSSLATTAAPVETSPGFSLGFSSPALTGFDLSIPVADEVLIRRHSLSLPPNPPVCSIAAEIINTRKTLLADIKDMQEQLSEFGSCVSEPEESSGNSEASAIGTPKKGKKMKKVKRKAGRTPLKSDEKPKKANLDCFEASGGNSNNL